MSVIEAVLPRVVDLLTTTLLLACAAVGVWRTIVGLYRTYRDGRSGLQTAAELAIGVVLAAVVWYIPNPTPKPLDVALILASAAAVIACTVRGIRFIRQQIGKALGALGFSVPILGRALFGAAILAWFDALFLGWGILSLTLVPLLVLIQLGRAGWDTRASRRKVAWERLAAATVWTAAGVAAVAFVGFNSSMAHRRADSVIAACREYEQDYRRLPQTLEDLVPRYLPAVPRARLVPVAGEFVYVAPQISPTARLASWAAAPAAGGPDRPFHTLHYLTPFGRPTYVFETDRWFGRKGF